MTDPIAEGVKLEDAIVILREGLRSDRPLTLKERLLIGKIIDERAALTAAGEMARELAEAREAALEEAAKLHEPSCSCSHPCDDYWIWPSPCHKKAAAVIRGLKTPKPRI